MTDKIFPIIGIVHFCRKRNCRNIVMRIKSDGEVYVSFPLFCSLKSAEIAVESRIASIRKKQVAIQEHKKQELVQHSQKHFTHYRDLEIETATDNSFRYKVTNDTIKIIIPNNHDISEEYIQTNIQKIIIETLRAEAKLYIPKRVEQLASEFGFNYTQVKISSAKTRWGCCSSQKHLTFSLFLMTLPCHLIDFVILHELCHTVHMNHSAAFYALHNQCLQGKLQEYEKEIKACKMSIFPKWE